MKVAALIYHDVLSDDSADDSGFAGADAASYKLPMWTFTKHLALLESAMRGARPACLSGAASVQALQNRQIVLTFDDGGASAVGRIAGSLGERGWAAHFFVPSSFIGQRGFLTASGIRQLHANGHVLGSHSATHPVRFSHLSSAAIRAEWRDSCDRLADVLGAPVVTASVPGGYYSDRVGLVAAECGVEVLFTSEPTCALKRIGSMWVAGRFSVTRRTHDAEVTALAQFSASAVMRQRLLWDAKKLAKQVGGAAWIALRKRLFEIGRK
jgi:peptidoglycan/xylan/chitin deacetylase (PgdA/CDA1 family)